MPGGRDGVQRIIIELVQDARRFLSSVRETARQVQQTFEQASKRVSRSFQDALARGAARAVEATARQFESSMGVAGVKAADRVRDAFRQSLTRGGLGVDTSRMIQDAFRASLESKKAVDLRAIFTTRQSLESLALTAVRTKGLLSVLQATVSALSQALAQIDPIVLSRVFPRGYRMVGRELLTASSMTVAGAVAAVLALERLADALLDGGKAAIEFAEANFQLAVAVRAAQRRFGEQAGTIDDWQQTISRIRQEYRMFSQRELTAAAARLISFTRELGFTQRENEQLLQGIIGLAAARMLDLESVATRVANALVGQRRGLELLGIDMSAAEIQQEAFRLGLVDTNRQLTIQENAIATLSLFMRKVGPILEDAAYATSNFAGILKELDARMEDAQREMGGLQAAFKVGARTILVELAEALARGTEKLEAFIAAIFGAFFALQYLEGRVRQTVTSLSGLAQALGVVAAVAGKLPVIGQSVQAALESIGAGAQGMADGVSAGAQQTEGVLEGMQRVFEETRDQVRRLFEEGMFDDLADVDITDPYEAFNRTLEEFRRRVPDLGAEFADILEDSYKSAEEIEQDFGERLAEIQEDYMERRLRITEDFLERIRRLEEDAAIRRQDIIEDMNQRLADLVEDVARRRQEVEDDYNTRREDRENELKKKLLQLEEDYQRRRREIIEQYAIRIDEAVQQRDARQILNLQRRRAEELRQLDEDFEVRKRRLIEDFEDEREAERRNYEKRLKDLEDYQRRREREIREAAERQLRDLNIQLERQRRDAWKAYMRQLHDLNRALARQEQDLRDSMERQKEELRRSLDERLVMYARKLADEGKVTEEHARKLFETLVQYFGLPDGYISKLIEAFVERMRMRMIITIAVEESIGIPQHPGFGGPVPPGEIIPRAHGGVSVVDRPTLFLAGERGRELAAFIPLTGGFVQRSGGFGARTVYLNINGRLTGVYKYGPEFEEQVARVLADAIVQSGVLQ